jgi:hypothetical protein
VLIERDLPIAMDDGIVLRADVVLQPGSRLALTVAGRDFEREDGTGSAPFLHRDPADRPKEVFGGVTTLHTGDGGSFLLAPIIPAKATVG